jgi:ATP-dependent DNA helicase RecG
VIDNKIILELKALPFLGTTEKKQTWNYLKGSDYKLALLANFSPTKVEIERIVYDSARVPSASHPQESASSSASVPHLLSMTATPIPRTLALTIYGDLDLSLLDELPAGRKPIKTEIVPPTKRQEAYELIRKEVAAGRQAYVICPRIDEPDPTKELALQAKSARSEAIRLQEKVFPEFEIGLLHSKLKPKEKEEVLADFGAGRIDILVSTSVVEVGVNFPNATVIAIEGAERFGLAQLHQLRGRVLRSSHQAYCFIFSESKSQISLERLKALVKAKSGFELAELDLSLRGAGSLAAGKQWGLSDLGMEALKNLKMVELARTEAQKLIATDPQLKKYPLIVKRLESQKKPIHFE